MCMFFSSPASMIFERRIIITSSSLSLVSVPLQFNVVQYISCVHARSLWQTVCFHSTLWFYSSQQVFTELQRFYIHFTGIHTYIWICSTYIFWLISFGKKIAFQLSKIQVMSSNEIIVVFVRRLTAKLNACVFHRCIHVYPPTRQHIFIPIMPQHLKDYCG